MIVVRNLYFVARQYTGCSEASFRGKQNSLYQVELIESCPESCVEFRNLVLIIYLSWCAHDAILLLSVSNYG